MQKQQGKLKPLSESTIQTRVKIVYEKAGWLVNKIIQTTLNGWPDLECYKNGVTLFVECKAPGEKPSALQLYRHQQLRDKGFTVHVVDYYLNKVL
jgi:hypothetical protein